MSTLDANIQENDRVPNMTFHKGIECVYCAHVQGNLTSIRVVKDLAIAISAY